MPRHAFLNELSFVKPHRVPTEQGRELFERLFRLLRELNRQSDGLTIIGHSRLIELAIGDCTVGEWLRDDPDRMRRLKSLDDRAPFQADTRRIAEETSGDLEYHYMEEVAIGLGLAAWHGDLAISIDRSPWQTEWVELQRFMVYEDEDGSVADETTTVRARHATDATHLQAHQDWLQPQGRDLPRTPHELWLNRFHWYPNIAFTARARSQIRALLAGSPAFQQVAEKLATLQDALRDWNGVGAPAWQIKVVPENEQRHRYCEFTDLDGETRLFELHVRYTPSPNRIHFRLDVPGRRIVVAHVGRKLGV